MVRVTGLEPARGYHQNLNLARLPIPPYPQIFFYYKAPTQKPQEKNDGEQSKLPAAFFLSVVVSLLASAYVGRPKLMESA